MNASGPRDPRRRGFPLVLEGASMRETPTLLRPQRPVLEAALEAQRADRPETRAGGLGLDSPQARAALVERVRRLGVRDQHALAALGAVPRHRFIDSALAAQAYEDTSLPIGHGQTISKPSVVARMIELLFRASRARGAGHLGRVLEIGTGCGYQTAVLARVARSVFSVERLQFLHERARDNLASLRSSPGYADIRLIYGDGLIGHPPNAPYDAIIVAAAGDDLPRAWIEQLRVGGRLVAPHRETGAAVQRLVVLDRIEGAACVRRSVHEAVNFVPLKSGRE